MERFKLAWSNYSLATALNEKNEAVQVATLLTVIGEEAREVFSTFSGWATDGDESKIGPVLAKFEQYCQPRKHVPFERYRFNRRCRTLARPTISIVQPYASWRRIAIFRRSLPMTFCETS